MAGHDINYIAISGALGCFARKGERPLPPVNLLGDFAGGGMLCAMGVVLALFERSRSGRGQVIDSAMVDGAANLAAFLFGFRAAGLWSDEAGTNLLDTGAPFYDTYETAAGKFMSVGAIEPQFYAKLLEGLGARREPNAPPVRPGGMGEHGRHWFVGLLLRGPDGTVMGAGGWWIEPGQFLRDQLRPVVEERVNQNPGRLRGRSLPSARTSRIPRKAPSG